MGQKALAMNSKPITIKGFNNNDDEKKRSRRAHKLDNHPDYFLPSLRIKANNK